MLKNDRPRILLVLLGCIVLSLSQILYLTYFVVFRADTVKHHAANRRSWIEESEILRGSIYDRNGELLAYSDGEVGKFQRFYNYPRIYCHIVGYAHPAMGKAGLESSFNDYLLNRNGNRTWKSFLEWATNRNRIGNNLILTVDTNLQQHVHDIMAETGVKGAAVVLNPKTGEVYAMVSMPDYDAQKIQEDWDNISKSTDGILVNRAVSGRYPPGSTFKIITSTALLEHPEIDQSYTDEGTQKIGARVFKNFNAEEQNGKVNLREAFAQSLNTYFVSKGVEIGKENLGAVADKYMFNQEVPFDLPLKKSVFNYKKRLDDIQVAASSIGQGDVLATPLEMAMVAGAIANDGKMMKPYLVRDIQTRNGAEVQETTPEELSTVSSPEVVAELQTLMKRVVSHGSGSRAQIRGMRVAGKTGTAENASGKSHAWFVGYAPADEPRFAVAVILEEADQSGGVGAAPIARDILIYANRLINVVGS